MAKDNPGSVTKLIKRHQAGDPNAREDLFKRVNQELRWVAHKHRQSYPGVPLESVEIVNQAYLRIEAKDQVTWDDRKHLFFTFARAIDDVLYEEARKGKTTKRGGKFNRVEFEDIVELSESTPEGFLAVREAISRLYELDAVEGGIVRLYFFAGLNLEEIQTFFDLSPRQFSLRWKHAKAWLRRELSE